MPDFIRLRVILWLVGHLEDASFVFLVKGLQHEKAKRLAAQRRNDGRPVR